VMINRGLPDDELREAHREGWDGSFDNLTELLITR
jgi:hypothetical protein